MLLQYIKYQNIEKYYILWPTGQAGKMLRKQIALQETQPKR